MSLRIDLGVARNQGQRPTCLSFALSELHRANLSFQDVLSPESLHRLAIKRAKKAAHQGLVVVEAVAALSHDGQTTEVAWPYHTEQALDLNCTFFRVIASPMSFDEAAVVTDLQMGMPIILVIDVDMSWYLHAAGHTLNLDPNFSIEARHAVVICGYRVGSTGPEYLIKNSWGGSWGDEGHAWVALAYIEARTPELIRI